jgi:hypothetical protein
LSSTSPRLHDVPKIAIAHLRFLRSLLRRDAPHGNSFVHRILTNFRWDTAWRRISVHVAEREDAARYLPPKGELLKRDVPLRLHRIDACGVTFRAYRAKKCRISR